MPEYEVAETHRGRPYVGRPGWEEESEPRSYFMTITWRPEGQRERTLKSMVEHMREELRDLRLQVGEMRGAMKGAQTLAADIRSGRFLVLPTEPIALPEFPPDQVREVKARILAETVGTEPFDPMDFAEKRDLDVLLVFRAIHELVKEGVLLEVSESPTR